MKKTIAWVTLIAAATFLASVSTVRAECVSQSLLTWVDNREANAISPARWQAVRNSLLERDGGMPLADMQVIYDRRVRNGWSAGHWVPILSAMNCLAEQPEPEPEQVEEQPAQAAKAEAEPAQAEAEPAQEPTPDISQPPASFAYFDTTTDTEKAWGKWGSWNSLHVVVRQSIHDSVGLDHAALASGCGGFDSGGLACTPLGENLQEYNLNLNRWRWSGNFTNYTLHPIRRKSWDLDGGTPKMVFEYDPSNQYDPWFAYVEYTRSDGRKFSADHWYGLSFENGSIRDKDTRDGTGNDGLSATFYRKNDYWPQYADNLPANAFLIGEVRRPKLIGTFVTGTGQSR